MYVAQLHSMVYELIGEASMCWTKPPEGIFDTDRAIDIGDKFNLQLAKLEKVIDAARYVSNSNGLNVAHSGFPELREALKELDEHFKRQD